MSLSEKVIKNTYYYFFSQVISLLMPLFLTPFIIMKIGDTQFGIYTLILGVLGTFGLLDLSLSTSFIKFISEYFHKNNIERLNNTVSTGFYIYLFFTIILTIIAFFSTDYLASVINIPADLTDTFKNTFRISLLIFFLSNAFGIFSTVLIVLQKMYITSIINVVFGLLNFISVIILLNNGFGLYGIIWSQAITMAAGILFTVIYSYRSLPQMKISLSRFSKISLKEMSVFGLQMQISKMATFASDKFDELLLGVFTSLNNVTLFNVGNRIVRFGKFFPSQFIVQIAPVAAELKSKEEEEKLNSLMSDMTKYLVVITSPLFVYIFIFSQLIIFTWLGEGYETASLIVKILIAGQLANIALSAPGNSIIPNIGQPKYQMYEGLIHLLLNVSVSYFLIRQFGVIGAAYGNTIATVIASSYVFIVSVKFFGKNIFDILKSIILPPVIYSFISGAAGYLVYYIVTSSFNMNTGGSRFYGIIFLLILALIVFIIYSLLMYKSKYLNEKDTGILKKFLYKFIPSSFKQ